MTPSVPARRGRVVVRADDPRVVLVEDPLLLGRHPSDASFHAGLGWLLDGIAGARR
jgi:hypothetical protein